MSLFSTEKIASTNSTIKPQKKTQINENNSSHFLKINEKYSSPFKKMPSTFTPFYSPSSKGGNSTINTPDNKSMPYYTTNQYFSFNNGNNSTYNYYNYSSIRNINYSPRETYFPIINNENNRNMNHMEYISKNIENESQIKKKYSDLDNNKINMNINMNVNNNIYNFSLGENPLNLISEQKIREEKSKKKFYCNCKKTECLKLYCDCFANGEKCIDCNCRNCWNIIGNELVIKKVYDEVVGKNPISLKLNLQKEKIINGCNCNKSNCLKKYCECYKAGLECSSCCRCRICENGKKIENNKNEEEKSEKILKNRNNIEKNDYKGKKDEEKRTPINTEENDKNINIKINNIEKNCSLKYKYDKYTFEKISILIQNSNIYIQIYKYLKTLNLNDELKDNVILLSDINRRIINIPKKKLIIQDNNLFQNKDNSKDYFLNKKTKRKKEDIKYV
jgi:hypothetical protein